MALDPKQTFGKVGPTAMQAPQAAKITPQQSIQGATVAHIAFEKLGDQIANVGETIRKAGTVADRQQLDERNAERTRLAVEAQSELDNEEITQGRKYTVDELTTNYKAKLATINGKLAEKYKFNFATDEADSDAKTFEENVMTQFTKTKLQPRTAELNRDGLLGEREQLNKAAQAKLANGDRAGAMELYQQASAVFDKPNAAIAFDPAQRAQMKNATLNEGVLDWFSKMPAKEQIAEIDKHFALDKAAADNNSPELRQASLLRGVDPSWLAKQREGAVNDVFREEQLEKARFREKQAEVTSTFRNQATIEMRTAMANSDVRALSKLESRLDNIAQDIIKNGPSAEKPDLDALTSFQGQIISAKDRIQEKAERAAERAEAKRERAALKAEILGQYDKFNGSKYAVDTSDPEGKKFGNKSFERFVSTLPATMAPEKKETEIAEWIKEKRFVPQMVSSQIEQSLRSEDPKIAAQGAARMNKVMNLDPSLRDGFSKEAQFVYDQTQNGSASIPESREQFKVLGRRSPEQIKEAEKKSKELIKDDDKVVSDIRKAVPGAPTKGFFFQQSTTSTPKGTEVPSQYKTQPKPSDFIPIPPQMQHEWKNGVTQGFLQTEDEAVAKDYATRQMTQKGGWATVTTTGEPAYKKGYPQSYGIPDGRVKQDTSLLLKQFGRSGNEPFLLDQAGSTSAGAAPAYRIKVPNPVTGRYEYLLDKNNQPVITVYSDRPVAEPIQEEKKSRAFTDRGGLN